MLKVFAYDKLMIVAHPDDEVIFGGAQLLNQYGWKVICVTNASEPIRSTEFHSVMKRTSCIYEMWDYLDRSNIPFPQDQLTASIKQALAERTYKMVVTHSKNGEYGHLHHIQIHETVASLTTDFYVFGKGDLLPQDIWQRKLELINLYQSQEKMCRSLSDFAKRECLQKYGTM